MKQMTHYYTRSLAWFRNRENVLEFLFFTVVFIIFFINAFHEQYPDEFDNILGGWYIIHGLPIYSQWFTHHGPVAYFIAGFIELFTRNSFVAFRAVYGVVLFLFTLGTYTFLVKKFGKVVMKFYLIFIFLLALMGNYYWLHMLLADSISAFFFAPVFALLLLATLMQKSLTLKDIAFVSVLTSLSILSSLTYVYFSLIIYLYTFFYFLYSNKVRLLSKEIVFVVLLFVAPYAVCLFYLLVTLSLQDYLYDAIVFNQKYYIYNYPRPPGTTFINPIRFAIVIANNFYNSYVGILYQVPSFNVNFPLNITMGVGSLGLLIYLVLRKYYIFFVVTLGLIIYSNARSNPLTSGERDYQSAVYIALAFLAISFLLSRIPRLIEETKDYRIKILMGGVLVLISIYTFYTTAFLFQKFFNRSYGKYMGTQSLIYDRPHIAPILNNLIAPNDPIWVGPFEFGELFYTHGKPASKYQILLPGMGGSPKMQQGLLADLDRTRPKIIWFQKNFFILGRSPEQYGQFFISYLKNNYVTVGDYVGPNGEKYKSLVPVDEWIDIEGRMYMRKDAASEVIQSLLSHNYIAVKAQEQ